MNYQFTSIHALECNLPINFIVGYDQIEHFSQTSIPSEHVRNGGREDHIGRVQFQCFPQPSIPGNNSSNSQQRARKKCGAQGCDINHITHTCDTCGSTDSNHLTANCLYKHHNSQTVGGGYRNSPTAGSRHHNSQPVGQLHNTVGDSYHNNITSVQYHSGGGILYYNPPTVVGHRTSKLGKTCNARHCKITHPNGKHYCPECCKDDVEHILDNCPQKYKKKQGSATASGTLISDTQAYYMSLDARGICQYKS